MRDPDCESQLNVGERGLHFELMIDKKSFRCFPSCLGVKGQEFPILVSGDLTGLLLKPLNETSCQEL